MSQSVRAILAIVALIASQLCTQATEPPGPVVVAHRGLIRHAPENTLASFRACLELRVGFEFDVQRTKDGHLVCIHDDTVNRTTDGKGKVENLTLDQIRELDAGSWFSEAFAGEKVPTVEAVLKLVAEYREHQILVAADLKANDVASEVVQLAEEHDVLDRILFIGRTIADPQVREAIAAASGNAYAAAVANRTDEFSAALASPNADWVYFRYLPSSQQIESVDRANKRAFIAGPKVAGHLPLNWQQATEVGIDAILTDFPLRLAALLREQVANSGRP